MKKQLAECLDNSALLAGNKQTTTARAAKREPHKHCADSRQRDSLSTTGWSHFYHCKDTHT